FYAYNPLTSCTFIYVRRFVDLCAQHSFPTRRSSDLERATIMYADLDQSTALVENHHWYFAAEVYKTFLYAATRLANNAGGTVVGDRKSTRLNSSHVKISYAVFCLKKKKH